jgi:hypothetical protein
MEDVPASIRIHPSSLPIIRTEAGGFFGFGGHDGPKLDNFEGRFAQLLPPKRPDAEGIDLARAILAAMGVTEERLRGNAAPTWSSCLSPVPVSRFGRTTSNIVGRPRLVYIVEDERHLYRKSLLRDY